MATLTVYSSPDATTERCLVSKNATYATAQAAVAADEFYSTQTVMLVGQGILTGPLFAIYRSFVIFDTSSIPSTSTISSAVISLYCAGDSSATDFDVVLRNGQDTYPHNPLSLDDFNKTFYSGDGGSFNTLGIVTDSYTDLTLNETGKGWIKKGVDAKTKLALISSRDISATENSGSEYVFFYSDEHANYKPKLTVVYSPNATLTVTTNNVSNINGTVLTANANITDTGGFTVTRRGFQYGLTQTATWTVQDTGSFPNAESYSKIITGLTEGTKYYIRAVVENTNSDISYGDWVGFIAGKIYGLYEETNTATICFYLSEDDGKTWGQKHGPYTEDQADIEITKLLVRGSGKKKIKFTSDTLTGISVSVMCKLDLKAR